MEPSKRVSDGLRRCLEDISGLISRYGSIPLTTTSEWRWWRHSGMHYVYTVYKRVLDTLYTSRRDATPDV